MVHLLVFSFEFLFVEIVEVEVASMLLRIPMLRAEGVLTATLHTCQSDFLLAVPASSLVLLSILSIANLPRLASKAPCVLRL